MDKETPTEGFRLSPQQRRLWLLQSCETAAPYGAECHIEIDGDLDAGALEQALRATVERHEILRSTFRHPVGAKFPMQVIGALESRFTAVDLSTPASEGLDQELSRPHPSAFELDQGCQLDARLTRLGEHRHALRLALPAMCGDMVSLFTLAREIASLYTGDTEALADPIQYADLADWQDEILEGEDAEPGREFWRGHSEPDAFAVEVASRRPRADAGSFEPRRCPMPLDEALSSGLAKLCERCGTPPSIVLLAAWLGYFGRLLEQPAISAGACFSGRSYDGLEDAVGPLERFLPVTFRFEPGIAFSALAAEVAKTVEQFHEWQEYFSWSSVEGSSNLAEDFHLPLAFRFDETPEAWTSGGLTFRPSRCRAVADRFLLCPSWSVRDGQTAGELAYDGRLFDESDAQRIAEGYLTLLRSLTEEPGRELEGLGALEVLGPRQRTQLLEEFNTTARGPVDPAIGFLDLFAEQVREHPEKPALRCGTDELSFSELDRGSDELSRRLRDAGVESDDLVALFLERSTRMVVAQLGILKAGGAYLPLDPAYPRERLAHILESAGAATLVTRAELAGELPENGARRIDLAQAPKADAEQRAPAPRIAPGNLAYVKYTSGSTGKPKGVMVTHGNVGHCLQALAERLPVDATSVYLHTASFAFSSSTRHLLFPLSVGATVVIATGEQRTDPTALLRTLDEEGVSVLDTVPSMWRGGLTLLDRAAPDRSEPRGLRLCLSTGEALASDVAAGWRERLGPELEFFNLYGITETATTITAHAVTGAEADQVAALGRPIADTQVYPLDRRGRPVSVGAVAELHVGGGSPGRGYYDRPATTAERFVPNPFSGRRGDRLFKTGDLGSFRAEGTLEFHGRIDYQIQIRGFRVEPEEIETALERHPSVERCAALARERGDGASLVAFFVPAFDKVPEIPRLRGFLRESLPAYMIPNELLPIAELPLSPHGKVDYKALAKPSSRQESAEPYVAPETPIQEQLAEIWKEALDVKRVGIHDDFIEIGGHSMTAILIVSKIREVLGLEVPVVRLFEIRTVAELGELVEELQLAAAGAEDLADILGELDGLSDDEVDRQLSKELV